jgi:hypothetical protein
MPAPQQGEKPAYQLSPEEQEEIRAKVRNDFYAKEGV